MRKASKYFLALMVVVSSSACVKSSQPNILSDTAPKATLITHHGHGGGFWSSWGETVTIAPKLENNCGQLRRLGKFKDLGSVVETEISAGNDLFIRAVRTAGDNRCEVNLLVNIEANKSYEVEFINFGRKVLFANMRRQCSVNMYEIEEERRRKIAYRRAYIVLIRAPTKMNLCESEKAIRGLSIDEI